MSLRGRGLSTKASRSRARSNPPDDEEIALAVQRLRDKLRETQPFYLEEDVVVISFPSSDSGSNSPVHGAVPASLAGVPPFTLDDAVSPPGSPTRALPTNARHTGQTAHATATTQHTTINLDAPLSATLFLTAVNLLDTKSIARSRRAAMDALKLVGQGYTLIWQDDEFIVDAAKQPPTPAVSFLNEDSISGRRSSSPAMGGVRAAVRGPGEFPSSSNSNNNSAATTRKSVSPVPTYRPAPRLVTMLDACMQSLLVYANKSSTLSQFITAHQPTLHLFCFIGSAARAVEEGGEWADTTELLADRPRTRSSSSSLAAASTETLDTVPQPQRDVEVELRELGHLWETCGLAGTRLADHLRECYLTEFLLDAALPPAVCSARYDGVLAALADKKRRLIAELASSRSPLTNMLHTLPLRSVMGLLNMSASAEPKQRAKLLDKLVSEGLLDVVLQHIQASIAEWLRWSSSSTASSPSSLASTASPSVASSTQGAHWSARPQPKPAPRRTSPSPSKSAAAASTAPSLAQTCAVHLQYIPVSSPTTPLSSSSPPAPRGRASRSSREEACAAAAVRPDPPLVRLGFCVEVLLLLTSPNLRHPQEADELARHPKTAASAVVKATLWAEETDALAALVAYLLWIIAASSVAFEEEVSLELFRVPTSLLASLQEQAMDCVLQLAAHSSALYGVVVETLERLLSDRLVLTVGAPPSDAAPESRTKGRGGRRSVSPARRASARTSRSSPASATPSSPNAATRPTTVATRTVHVQLTGAGGLLPLLVSLLSRAEAAQTHARGIRHWFAWLTAHLVPSAFEHPTLTNGRRSTLAWGTTAAAAAAAATRKKTSPRRASRSRSSTPPPAPAQTAAPVLARDLRRDEVASLLPYFRFGTRLVLETSWRAGAEAFLARLAILAYHVVLGGRNNLSFGQASACYDAVAPLLQTVSGLLPGQVVRLEEEEAPGPSSAGDATPASRERGWLQEDLVLVHTPSTTPSEAGGRSASPGSTHRKKPGGARGGGSPRRGPTRTARDSVQTFIPSPSRSPIFYEAYSPSSSNSPGERQGSPPRTPSKAATTPGKKRGRSPSSEGLTAPAPMPEPLSPPPATTGSPLATTRSSWRDRLSLRMFLSSLSLAGASATPHRASGEE